MSTDLAHGLGRIRKARVVFWAMWIGVLPCSLLATTLLGAQGSLFLLPHGLACVVVWLLVSAATCPRCGERFHGPQTIGRIWTPSCRSCGLGLDGDEPTAERRSG